MHTVYPNLDILVGHATPTVFNVCPMTFTVKSGGGVTGLGALALAAARAVTKIALVAMRSVMAFCLGCNCCGVRIDCV